MHVQRYKGGKKPGREDGYSVGSPGLYENRVLVPKVLRCFSADVRRCSRAGIYIYKHSVNAYHVRLSERTRHSFEQPLFVNEWDLYNSLPLLFFAIQIQFKVEGIKVQNW